MSFLFYRSILLALLLTIVTGCGRRETQVQSGDRTGILHVASGGEPRDLDPTMTIGTAESRILLGLFEGLVSLSPEGKIIPGAAERWETSADGRVYTFHLRPGMKWSNGDPLGADDFLYGFRRVLEPKLGAEAAQFAFIIKGARAYLEGRSQDPASIGLRVVDPLAFEITLEHPAPYFVGELFNYPFYPLHRATLEKFNGYLQRASAWTRPGNLVGNGPFRLVSWRVNDSVVLEKNPQYWDAAKVRLNGVHFYAIDNVDAEERAFRAGRLHATFGLAGQKTDAYRAEKSPALHSEPILQSTYITFNVAEAPFTDARVRQALSFAVNREALARDALRGQRPASNLAVRGAGDYVSRSPVPYDLVRARALLAEAGFPGGAGFPKVTLTYSASRAGWKEACEAVQFMWERELGVRIALAQIEYKVWLDALRTRKHQFVLDGWASSVDDPVEWFGLFVADSPNNDAGWFNPGYDESFAAAENSADPAERLERFQKLDALLLAEMPVVPLYFMNRDYLLQPSVRGWQENALGVHPLKHLWLEAK